jgi:MOSC domain-containing protein YiiM/ferredoxin-NADP reductase/ferredoxin
MAPIPAPTTLLAVNTGVMAPLGQLSIKSGIVKSPQRGCIRVSSLGLVGDEHDPTFHGGLDKALHQYCTAHYLAWRTLYPDPEIQARFVPGGFGENLVAEGLSDANVCIGDVVRIGWPRTGGAADGEGRGNENGERNVEDEVGVLLEVSLPRQPCFKLNTRFGIKNFAKRTLEFNRTGWYYRVIREGWIEAGMEIRVLERKHPRWTIEMLQHYSHHDLNNRAATEELAGLKPLGMEARRTFQERLRKMIEKDEKNNGGKKTAAETWREYKIVEKRQETPRITRLVLESLRPITEVRDIAAGSHARIRLPNGLIRAYSIVDGTPNKFTICVALADHSRGGSQYLRDTAQVCDLLSVGKITTSAPVAFEASNHILIAGGVGITAFIAAVKMFEEIHLSYELHYAVRSSEDVAFAAQLEGICWGRRKNGIKSEKGGESENRDANGDLEGGCNWEDKGDTKIRIYDKSKGQRMDVSAILAGRKWNSHVYVCGPPRMMDAVLRTAEEGGLASGEVHYEAFQATTTGDPFTAEVVISRREGEGWEEDGGREENKGGDEGREGGGGKFIGGQGNARSPLAGRGPVLQVGADQTLLEVLRAAGFEMTSSCEVGNCGTCRVRVRSGRVEHRGSALDDEEKQNDAAMLACVSRGVGHLCIELD